MRDIKITPGKWSTNLQYVWGSGKRVIADLEAGGLPSQEQDANARAITAVPEMLQALIDVLDVETRNPFLPARDYAEKHDKAFAAVRAAITKAIGQTCPVCKTSNTTQRPDVSDGTYHCYECGEQFY